MPRWKRCQPRSTDKHRQFITLGVHVCVQRSALRGPSEPAEACVNTVFDHYYVCKWKMVGTIVTLFSERGAVEHASDKM